MFKPCPAKGFDIVTDPIGQLTERQVALLFGRRDVSPAKATAAYGVTAGEAFGGGLGDIAIRYGYHRWQADIMIVTVVLLVILVQIFQFAGMKIAAKLDKRK